MNIQEHSNKRTFESKRTHQQTLMYEQKNSLCLSDLMTQRIYVLISENFYIIRLNTPICLYISDKHYRVS